MTSSLNFFQADLEGEGPSAGPVIDEGEAPGRTANRPEPDAPTGSLAILSYPSTICCPAGP